MIAEGGESDDREDRANGRGRSDPHRCTCYIWRRDRAARPSRNAATLTGTFTLVGLAAVLRPFQQTTVAAGSLVVPADDASW